MHENEWQSSSTAGVCVKIKTETSAIQYVGKRLSDYEPYKSLSSLVMWRIRGTLAKKELGLLT